MKQIYQKSLVFLLSCMAEMNVFAYDCEVNGIYYNLDNSTKSAEVTNKDENYNSYSGNVVIPETITYANQTYKVTSIGEGAFFSCCNLISVTISNNVTYIGCSAFDSCSSLSSVTIPNSMTFIDSYAFGDCIGLTSIIIPNNITGIAQHAFYGCTGLTQVTLNNNSIVSKAYTVESTISTIFGDQVKEYIIGNEVEAIGKFAFYGCENLISVNIPNSVVTIGSNAFNGCNGLKKVIVSDLAAWCAILFNNNPLYYAHHIYCDENTEITNLVIPNEVTKIGNNTFSGCTGLTSITIPNSVTGIGSSAFKNCTGLTSVMIPNSVTEIGYNAFYGCTGLTEAVYNATFFVYMPQSYQGDYTIPDGITTIYENAFNGCTGLTSITIPNSVSNIGSSAFNSCTGLTSITIPNSVSNIGANAFSGCTGLTQVTLNNHSIASKKYTSKSTLSNIFGNQVKKYILGNEVEAIGEYAFSGSTELDSITIPHGVTSIGIYAFSGCTNLTSVIIPNSVVSIGYNSFSNCTNLTQITLNNNHIVSKEYMSSSSLSNIFGSQVKEYILGNEVKTIGGYAFYGCNNLTSVTIPISVTEIGNKAFYECSSLTSITIPNNVTKIGYSAFENCYKLAQVTLNSNSIANEFYYDNSTISKYFGNQVKKYVIGNDVETISKHIFYNSTALTSVVIGSRLSKIGESTFGGCTNLEVITVDAGNMVFDSRDNCNAIIETANNSLIVGCKATAIPNSVTTINNSAFYECTGLSSINIPNSVTTIGNSAFYGCTGLSSIIIPNSVTTIGAHAFRNCSGLTTVFIGSGVSNIDTNSFYDCNSLMSLSVDINNKVYDSREDCNALIETASNTLIKGSKNTVIPNSVTKIGYYAFRGYTNLKAISIPDHVTNIAAWAFEGCTGLISIAIPSSVTYIGTDAFKGCTGINTVTLNSNSIVSQSRTSLEPMSSVFGSQVKKYVLGEDVSAIGNYAFYDCSELNTISIPNGVKSIGKSAFDGCKGLTVVTLPNSVKTVDERAFKGCTGLQTINISDSITSISDYLFAYCNNLKSVIIPQCVKSIGSYAFINCYSLTEVYIPDGVTAIGQYAFNGCSSMNDVYCRAISCPKAGNNAFTYMSQLHVPRMSLNAYRNTEPWSKFNSFLACYDIEVDGIYYFLNQDDNTAEVTYNDRGNSASYVDELNIPQAVSYMDKSYDVTRIGEAAFYGCSGITSVIIPSGIKEINLNAFKNCSNIATVYLNSNDVVSQNRTYGGYNMQGGNEENNLLSRIFGSRVERYVLGDRVTSIGDNAFAECLGLTSINIPDKVSSIGMGAFANCACLTSINIPYKVQSIGADAFLNCPALTSVQITDVDAWCRITFGSAMANPLYYAHKLFLGESVVENVLFPNVTAINDYAFIGCSNLISVNMPNIVRSIGQEAFFGCQNLQTVNFGSGIKTVGPSAFVGCSKLKSCVLPNGTESIGKYAFSNCAALQDVVIPNTVASIGKYAFENCLGLYSVTSLVNIPFKLDETAFAYTGNDYDTDIIYNIAKLYVPIGRDAVYRTTTGWKKFMSIMETDTKFKLTYMLDGKEYKTYEIQATEVITPEPDPYKEGYIFSGWSDIPYLMPAQDVTVTGSFTIDPEYQVSIDTIKKENAVPEAYYSPEGRRLDAPQRGINIIKMSNGTTKKVVVK